MVVDQLSDVSQDLLAEALDAMYGGQIPKCGPSLFVQLHAIALSAVKSPPTFYVGTQLLSTRRALGQRLKAVRRLGDGSIGIEGQLPLS